jgi:LPPG:FO 2-phospho-L-lactate transferase
MPFGPDKSVVALCGGVGGAKLALGLQHVLDERLTMVVNVADDFDYRGLRICPDIDTVLYTLGGLNDRERGWGRADETWNFMAATKELGGEDWFALGDRDLAIHVERTRRLNEGASLTDVVSDFAAALAIKANILPVTDDEFRTKVVSSEGVLDFQHYFVRHRCVPRVENIYFHGAEKAKLSPRVREALCSDSLGAIIICPSNPFLSVDPILHVDDIRDAMKQRRVPVVAISPIISGQAIKGPTAKIMTELGIEVNTRSIANHYGNLIDGLVVDSADTEEAERLDIEVHFAKTLMTDFHSRISLANEALAFAARLAEN